LADLARPPGRGPRPACPSVLELTDGYLPFLQDSRHAAVFANVPLKFLVLWTDMQRYGRSHTLDTDVKGFDSHKSDNPPWLDAWLARTSCDTIVYVDIPTESPLHFAPPGSEGLKQYGEWLHSQRIFSIAMRRTFANSGCTVTVWKR